MGKSAIQIIDHPNGQIAVVTGVIDGTFDLKSQIGSPEILLFDLEGVTRITSFGVREWRTTISELGAKYKGFVNCHPSVVSQFNLVPGFACGGELISFYLPYVCPSCNQVAEGLLDLRADSDIVESLEPPAASCPKCSAQMEFDDIPAAYLKYARSVPRPRPPAAANAMIDAGTPTSPKRDLSVRKEVEDTVTAFWLSGELDNKRALRRLTEGVEGHVALVLDDLDAVTEEGMAGLVEFLREVGDAYLCRVPQRLIGPIVAGVVDGRLTNTRLVSIDGALACPACATTIHTELDQARLTGFLDGGHRLTTLEKCPQCTRALDSSAIPADVLAATARLPLTDAPEAVQVYLQHRSEQPAGGLPGMTRSYSAPAKLLFGKYRILRRLGIGGMGEVLLARYVGTEKFEKLVVIKRIRRDYVSNPKAMQEFQQEARITARLSHPNIVQIFDFGKFEDEYFFAMEYVNGIDLRHALRLCRDASMHWPAPLCMRVISDVCAGLVAAHSYTDEDGTSVPIYHRDVSPENILISIDGAVKLTDFGIAKVADSSVNTDSGVFKGKHTYSAPEQIELGLTADHRNDIYSTGVVLCEMLSLQRYFGDEVSPAVVVAAAMKPPRRLADARADVPDELQAIFERAVAPDRQQRYQSARELQTALEHLMKRGEYPTNLDLAAWIRKVIALRRDGADIDGKEDTIEHAYKTIETARGVATPQQRSLRVPSSTHDDERDS